MGEQQSEVVYDFVDGEVEDGEVAEVEVIVHALSLVELHQNGYLFLVELVELFSPF